MRVVGDTRACSHAMHAMPAGCARSEGTIKNWPPLVLFVGVDRPASPRVLFLLNLKLCVTHRLFILASR